MRINFRFLKNRWSLRLLAGLILIGAFAARDRISNAVKPDGTARQAPSHTPDLSTSLENRPGLNFQWIPGDIHEYDFDYQTRLEMTPSKGFSSKFSGTGVATTAEIIPTKKVALQGLLQVVVHQADSSGASVGMKFLDVKADMLVGAIPVPSARVQKMLGDLDSSEIFVRFNSRGAVSSRFVDPSMAKAGKELLLAFLDTIYVEFPGSPSSNWVLEGKDSTGSYLDHCSLRADELENHYEIVRRRDYQELTPRKNRTTEARMPSPAPEESGEVRSLFDTRSGRVLSQEGSMEIQLKGSRMPYQVRSNFTVRTAFLETRNDPRVIQTTEQITQRMKDLAEKLRTLNPEQLKDFKRMVDEKRAENQNMGSILTLLDADFRANGKDGANKRRSMEILVAILKTRPETAVEAATHLRNSTGYHEEVFDVLLEAMVHAGTGEVQDALSDLVSDETIEEKKRPWNTASRHSERIAPPGFA